jgi:hypothetical protein
MPKMYKLIPLPDNFDELSEEEIGANRKESREDAFRQFLQYTRERGVIDIGEVSDETMDLMRGAFIAGSVFAAEAALQLRDAYAKRRL